MKTFPLFSARPTGANPISGFQTKPATAALAFGDRFERDAKKKEPVFTADWFSWQSVDWPELLAEFKGKPNLNFLEIGSFEGRATRWLMDNILTHPTSHITCVDTFEGSQELDPEKIRGFFDRFNHNTAEYGDQVIVRRGTSHAQLPLLPPESYDFIYVDGSHRAEDVLKDAQLSFKLLKPGGIMLFDDYLWDVVPWDSPDHPKPGVDAFLEEFKDRYQWIKGGVTETDPQKAFQLAIRKNA